MFITILKSIPGDDYTVHRLLKKNFNGQRILYQRRKVSTHVLSDMPPQNHFVVSKNIDSVIENIKAGDNLDFSIRINPVVSKKIEPEKRRGMLKAVPCNDIERWLNARFIKYGFLADFTFEAEGFSESVKRGDVITINSLLVNGTMEVLNLTTLKQALLSGIGRAKSFGYGFLHIYDSCLVPVKQTIGNI